MNSKFHITEDLISLMGISLTPDSNVDDHYRYEISGNVSPISYSSRDTAINAASDVVANKLLLSGISSDDWESMTAEEKVSAIYSISCS